MKIYLAGKISKNGWRSELVPDMWRFDSSSDADEAYAAEWPTLPMVNGHEYVGPYFTSCDHGCAHMRLDPCLWHAHECMERPSTHGVNGGCIAAATSGGFDYLGKRGVTVRACLASISASDAMYVAADPDGTNLDTAHGTLVEIGYAVGIGLPVFLDQPLTGSGWLHPHGNVSESWFATFLAQPSAPGATLLERFKATFPPEPPRFDSPAEEAFWHAANEVGLDLDVQVPVAGASGKKYRVDFMVDRHAIEVDGFTYHDGKGSKQFEADRRRQRDLEAAGYRVTRFAASEVFADALSCARDAKALTS